MDQNLTDRLTRAESWLCAAVKLEGNKKQGEIDAQTVFIYRYIAFNSLYGRWKYEGSEKKTWQQLDEFFNNLLTLHTEDSQRKGTLLRNALARSQSYWLRLIENEFLDGGYWAVEEHRPDFKSKYHSYKFAALHRLNQQDYKGLLHSIFSRIVVLRNQILHGCATFGRGSLGWESAETANPVLRALIPAFHHLMAEYPGYVVWPQIPYPRHGSDQHPKRPPKT